MATQSSRSWLLPQRSTHGDTVPLPGPCPRPGGPPCLTGEPLPASLQSCLLKEALPAELPLSRLPLCSWQFSTSRACLCPGCELLRVVLGLTSAWGRPGGARVLPASDRCLTGLWAARSRACVSCPRCQGGHATGLLAKGHVGTSERKNQPCLVSIHEGRFVVTVIPL